MVINEKRLYQYHLKRFRNLQNRSESPLVLFRVWGLGRYYYSVWKTDDFNKHRRDYMEIVAFTTPNGIEVCVLDD